METPLLRDAMATLRELLPDGWRIEMQGSNTARDVGIDAIATISAPDKRKGKLCIEAKSRVTPRDAFLIAGTIGRLGPGKPPLMVVSPFLSRSTRACLKEAQLNWLDLTGNVRLVLRQPGLFVETQGAERQAGGGKGSARSLKGQTAGRVVQAMVSAKLPIGVVDLAKRAGTDPGYTSRVVEFLAAEALVEREKRGPVTKVDRPKLVRRWAEDAPYGTRGEIFSFLEPRGLPALLEKLLKTQLRYAITGSQAAQQWAPIAAPRLAQIYVAQSAELSAEKLGLRPGGEGANVQLIRPNDSQIIESAKKGPDGLYYVKPLQAAADLLTSPGRAPAEGEELLAWMSKRPNVWD